MSTGMINYKQANTLMLGRNLTLGRELARGGEGKIYAIVEDQRQVAKIFHKPSPEKNAKLNAMLANPPHDPTRKALNHISIAWPTARILDTKGRCIGFTMPYIDHSSGFPLLKIYNPQDRRQIRHSFTWQYLLRMARNLCSIIAALHQKGYVVGDLNESNILVTPNALVTLVDCDSIQVPRQRESMFHRQSYFLCTVGKPEYTPPELQGHDLKTTVRKAYHDNFSLAVLIFLMLMEGRHPYAGSWQGNGTPPTLAKNIQTGDFPYGNSYKLSLPKYALPLSILSPPLQYLMLRCFGHTPFSWLLRWRRPSAKTWYRALGKAEQHLKQCTRNSSHVYSLHLHYCPWCKRVQVGIPDPFPVAQNGTSQLWHYPHVRHTKLLLRIQRLLLFLLSMSLYAIGAYLWPFYGHWIIQASFQIKCVVIPLLLLTPLFLYLVLSLRYRTL